MYNFDMEKITQFEPRPALKFWNPTLDFVGIIESWVRLGISQRQAT